MFHQGSKRSQFLGLQLTSCLVYGRVVPRPRGLVCRCWFVVWEVATDPKQSAQFGTNLPTAAVRRPSNCLSTTDSTEPQRWQYRGRVAPPRLCGTRDSKRPYRGHFCRTLQVLKNAIGAANGRFHSETLCECEGHVSPRIETKSVSWTSIDRCCWCPGWKSKSSSLPPDAVDAGLRVQTNHAVAPDPLVRNDLVRTTPTSLS
jgi:hypothetical protein